jgi:mono/diheme cytochrome c family protein
VAIETAFGTFYGTNITPDPTWGIGAWSDADFVRAMRCGIGPDGRRFYPVFPFPSYTRMTDRDLLDLRAWLATVPPVAKPSPPHRIKPLYRSGLALRLWRSLTFEPGELRPDPTRSAAWNRGAYLVEGPGHCGECHTPRNRVGGLERHLAMAGSPSGAEGHPVPNITPDRETGIGRWSEEELVDFLKTGLLPDGDVTGGLMNRIVRNGTSRLTDADLRAMAVYLRSLPPVRRRVGGEAPAPQKEDW